MKPGRFWLRHVSDVPLFHTPAGAPRGGATLLWNEQRLADMKRGGRDAGVGRDDATPLLPVAVFCFGDGKERIALLDLV